MKKTLLAILLAAAGIAHAEFVDGNKLLSMMKTPGQTAIAMGYVSGVADALNGSLICYPEGGTVGQAHDMTRNFLEANPQYRERSADVIVGAALVTHWPCKKKSSAAQSKIL